VAGIVLEGTQAGPAEKAAFAKKLFEEKRAASIARMEAALARGGAQKKAKALAVPGRIISDETVEAGANHYTRKLSVGSHLRIIDIGGQQAVDFLCYDLADTEIRYNAANSIKLNRTIYVTSGFKLYSDIAEVLMTVVEDTVGFHDTIGGACSNQVNLLRYGIANTCSCRDNFVAALAKHGMRPRDIHANVNFFMNVPVNPDGSTQIEEGRSEPFDFVDLRAEKNVLVVLSNCPQFYNPCSGWNPTPIRLIEWAQA
jgi:urea carboxylase-associated protein 1